MPLDSEALARTFADCHTDAEREQCCRDIVAEVEAAYENPNTRLVYLSRIRKEMAALGVTKHFLNMVVLNGRDYEWRTAQHEGRMLNRQLHGVRYELVPQEYLKLALKALEQKDPIVRLLGVQALTGRRAIEVFKRGHIARSEYPGWALFTGQAKTKGRPNETYLIPILHPKGVDVVADAWAEASLDVQKAGIVSERYPAQGDPRRSQVKTTALNRSLFERSLRGVRKHFKFRNTTMLRSGWATYSHEWFGRPMQRLEWIACMLGHRTDVAGILVPDRETAQNYDVWDLAPRPSPKFPPAPQMPPIAVLVPGAQELATHVGTTIPDRVKPSVPVDEDEWDAEDADDFEAQNEPEPEPEHMPSPSPTAAPAAPVTPPVAAAPVEPPKAAERPPAPAVAPAKPATAPATPAKPPGPPQAARSALAEIGKQVKGALDKAGNLDKAAVKLSGEMAALNERLEAIQAEAAEARLNAERLQAALDVIAKFLPADEEPASTASPVANSAPASVPGPSDASAATAPTAAAAQGPVAPAVAGGPVASPAPAKPASRKGKESQGTIVKRLLEDGAVSRDRIFEVLKSGSGMTPNSFRVLLSRLTASGEIVREETGGKSYFRLKPAGTTTTS